MIGTRAQSKQDAKDEVCLDAVDFSSHEVSGFENSSLCYGKNKPRTTQQPSRYRASDC